MFSSHTHTHTQRQLCDYYVDVLINMIMVIISKCIGILSYYILHLVCVCMCVHTQSCQTLCDSMDCSPPGSSVHGIFQVRILEWVAISFSRVSFQPRDQTCVTCVSCICRRILYHWATWEALFYILNTYNFYLLIILKKAGTKPET